jgi:predicted CoA-binding protein
MTTGIKSTLILGASDNPERYSYLALTRLRQHRHPVTAIGRKASQVQDVEIETVPHPIDKLDTVTLYLNPEHQRAYYDYILSLKPRRVIFNPGAENPELETLVSEQGIEAMEACTLVLLSTGQY